MAKIINLENSPSIKSSSNCCWRADWISPLESPWGVFQKFKHANEADMKDILQLFGNDYVKKIKNPTSYKFRDLITLSAFNREKLSEVLKYDIVSENEKDLKKIFGVMPDWGYSGPKKFKRPIYLRKDLAFCEQCMKKGYHSLLHQFQLLSLCPFHLTPLKHECPACHTKIPYMLLCNEFNAPFVCKCGHHFLSNVENSLIHWEQTSIEEMKYEVVRGWMDLNSSQIYCLQNLFIDPNLNWELLPNALEKVYGLINDKDGVNSNQLDQYKHYVIKSSNCIENIRGLKEKYDHQFYTKKHFSNMNEDYITKLKYKEFVQEINKAFELTISGFAKHIRQKLSVHKTCIKRLHGTLQGENNDPICPYAYAYLNWRYSFQEYFLLKGVDNYRRPLVGEKNYLWFPSYFSHQLEDLFDYMNKKDVITEKSRASIKWGLNRIIIHFAYYYFLNWLDKAKELSERHIIVGTIPFEWNDVPYFILKLPQSKNENYEFHWWKAMNEEIKSPIKCPFNSIKKRKKHNKMAAN
ncbi:hypothetical protein [Paenibacillus piscarius]|uniref:hypothetical protein n=1 Tax=Paenibacillus piscarius TaxID=1089681 RepID=UPI001EE87E5D|nr:hypothetical protein [Paenibacillus piscarius]